MAWRASADRSKTLLCASGREGKAEIHQGWERGPAFLERMADAGKAVTDHFQGRIAYINVLRRMSVDCDCTGTSAAEPEARDLGILASTDILAVDQASIDWVGTLPPAERRPLEELHEAALRSSMPWKGLPWA